MQDSLNLTDAMDGVDVVRDVERMFRISITNGEAETTLTVGQLYDLIEKKCGAGKTQACLSQISFYQLRRALESLDSKTVIRPDTHVSIVRRLNLGSIARTWKQLGRQSRLRLPSLETPFLAKIPVAAQVIAISCAGVAVFAVARHFGFRPGGSFLVGAFGGIALIVAATSILHLVFRDIPRRIVTIGDLAREAAGHSYTELLQSRSRSSGADRWYALTAILRNISTYQRPITRDTTFHSR